MVEASEAYNAEYLAKLVKARLENQLEDALSDVEDRWSDDDPLTLPTPITYFYGYNPTVLEMESSEFPYVATLSPGREPLGRSEWGYQSEEVTVYVDFFCVSDDATTVSKITDRYAEAIMTVLQSDRWFGKGYGQRDFRPSVDISVASRHSKTKNADMFDEDDIDFIQGGRVEIVLQGG
jgi:hypothetical protein